MSAVFNLICSTAAITLAGSCLADDWQLRRLQQPTVIEIKAEQKGQIFIYDGLDSSQVERALDRNFRRIENMMFIRVQYAANDSENIPDDDCD